VCSDSFDVGWCQYEGDDSRSRKFAVRRCWSSCTTVHFPMAGGFLCHPGAAWYICRPLLVGIGFASQVTSRYRSCSSSANPHMHSRVAAQHGAFLPIGVCGGASQMIMSSFHFAFVKTNTICHMADDSLSLLSLRTIPRYSESYHHLTRDSRSCLTRRLVRLSELMIIPPLTLAGRASLNLIFVASNFHSQKTEQTSLFLRLV